MLPDLRCSGKIVRGQQERVDTVRRERRASERLIREPDGQLLVRRRLEPAPDVLDIWGVLRPVLLGHAHGHVTHGVRRSLVRGLERGRCRRLRSRGVANGVGRVSSGITVGAIPLVSGQRGRTRRRDRLTPFPHEPLEHQLERQRIPLAGN